MCASGCSVVDNDSAVLHLRCLVPGFFPCFVAMGVFCSSIMRWGTDPASQYVLHGDMVLVVMECGGYGRRCAF